MFESLSTSLTARHPRRDHRGDRAGLALGHGAGAGHRVRRLRVHRRRPAGRAGVQQRPGRPGAGAPAAGLAGTHRGGEPAGTRATLIVGGLVTIAFGVVLCARPGTGAVTPALLFGPFNLTAGTWMRARGTGLRRTAKTRHPARPAHPHTRAA